MRALHAMLGMALAMAAGAARAQDVAGEQVRSSVERVAIRDVADGSGPSSLIAIGRYLLVVDPWSRTIGRYDAAAPDAAPHVCTYPRSFAPWRTERTKAGVTLVSEPYGPSDDGRYDYRPRTRMTIPAAAVGAMAETGDCAFRVGRYTRSRAPRVAWAGGERPGSTATLVLDNGWRARLAPRRGGRIYGARDAGGLARGRRLVWWSEVDTDDALGGRVDATQYVGVVGANGGAPEGVTRLESAIGQPLVADGPFAASALLAKPGFEYVAASDAGGTDRVWVMASDSLTPGRRQFALLGFDAAGPLDGAGVIRLVAPNTPTIDRQDASKTTDDDRAGAEPFTDEPRARWFDAARALVQRQIAFGWTYPAAAAARPCGGADRCAVGADAAGALGTGLSFPGLVTDKIDTAGGANWMRPRHLIGVAAGTTVRGIPYSIGGADLADTFAARLAAGYAGDGAAAPPPIGHIREGMEWSRSEGNYPLGIDCSALIAKVYAIGDRSTGTMMRPITYVGLDGRRYRVPRGPDRGCPQPVRRLADLREGDIFLREGHVVIFAGETTLANALGGSRALLVLESSSRCGGVCESAYDPTYLAGWWMLRIRTSRDGEECPDWLDGDRRPRAQATPSARSVR